MHEKKSLQLDTSSGDFIVRHGQEETTIESYLGSIHLWVRMEEGASTGCKGEIEGC